MYLPIPYSKHCKVTYECDAVKFEDNRWRPSIYYNINYRTYKSDVEVKSISNEILESAKSAIIQTSKILLESVNSEYDFKESKELNINESLLLEIPGKGKSISKISVKLDAENLNQALRSTVLSVSFDGNETVWVPVGEFFGTGYQINSSKTWYTKVDENGVMEASWIMPLKK